jgi:hypothetical protein
MKPSDYDDIPQAEEGGDAQNIRKGVQGYLYAPTALEIIPTIHSHSHVDSSAHWIRMWT